MECCNKSPEPPPTLRRNIPSLTRKTMESATARYCQRFYSCVCLSLPTTNNKQTTKKKQANENTILAFLKKNRSKSSLSYGRNILCTISKIKQVAIIRTSQDNQLLQFCGSSVFFSMKILPLCWLTKRPPTHEGETTERCRPFQISRWWF